MKIKILGISGSPRHGNSLFWLTKALAESVENDGEDEIVSEIFSFAGKKMSPCISCYKCWDAESSGVCIIPDDFQILKEKWLESDVVIYSLPVYHLSIPGQVKCFWDRLGNSMYKTFSKASCRHLKAVGCLTQGMHIHSGQELAIQAVITHSILMKCVPVAGDGWHSYTGAAAWTVLREDVDALDNLMEDQEDLDPINLCGFEAAKSVVKRCVTVARILKHGGLALVDDLKKDERFVPFLQRMGDRQ